MILCLILGLFFTRMISLLILEKKYIVEKVRIEDFHKSICEVSRQFHIYTLDQGIHRIDSTNVVIFFNPFFNKPKYLWQPTECSCFTELSSVTQN